MKNTIENSTCSKKLMNIMAVSVSATALNHLKRFGESWNQSGNSSRVELTLHYIGSSAFTPQTWPVIFDAIARQDIIFLDLMGAPSDFCGALVKRVKAFPGQLVVVGSSGMGLNNNTRLGEFNPSGANEAKKKKAGYGMAMQTIAGGMEKGETELSPAVARDLKNYTWLVSYWHYATQENIKNLVFLLGREYAGFRDMPEAEPPVTLEEMTILDSARGLTYETTEAYWRDNPKDPDKPTVCLLFSPTNYPVDTHPLVHLMVEKLHERFNVLPVATLRVVDEDVKRLAEFIEGEAQAIVNLLPFRLGAGPRGGKPEQVIKLIKQLNIPLMHPLLLNRQTRKEWLEETRGALPGPFVVHIFLPELDGATECIPIGAMTEGNPDAPDGGFGELGLITERMERLCRKLRNWVTLRRIPNRRKKLALIMYNYPPGEAHVAHAAFLDTFESVSAMLAMLHEKGYEVEPLSGEEIRRRLVNEGKINSPRWHLADRTPDLIVSKKAVPDLPNPEKFRQKWGPFPGELMCTEDGVIIPGFISGNVFIGLQPTRGFGEEQAKNYHSKDIPPHHQYVGFYKWLEREFKANVCVHIGTHGSVELVPGKEMAMSGNCWPDYLMGQMPHLYFYYTGNPSEAMVAKRRSHGVLLSHLPVPFKRSDLYGSLQTLEDLMGQYAEAEQMGAGRKVDLFNDINAQAQELGWRDADLEEIHRRLYEYKTSLIPSRLHRIGQGYSTEETTAYLVQLFKLSGEDRPSLWAILAARRGWDWESMDSSPQLHTGRMDALELEATEWVQRHVILGEPVSKSGKADEPALIQLREKALQMKDWLTNNPELESFHNGLNSGFIAPGLGGDMFRNPEVMPSGRNLFQFDPRQVPSPVAMRRGAEVAENTLAEYRRRNGDWPQSVALILWGLETARTHGETVSQVFTYLGVRLKRQQGMGDPYLEVIPPSELGRPRIDVTIQICGFFRDMFPNLLPILADAFERVALLKETGEQNHIIKNAALLKAELIEQGADEDQVDELSLARVFGPAPGTYGTLVNDLVKSAHWQAEGDLVSAFLDSLQHAYTKNHYGSEQRELLTSNLKRVEMVSQIRCSVDREITDLDHYYEYFGGLSRAVEEYSGKRPIMLISDSTLGRVRTEDISSAIGRGARTRILNPKWIQGMLGHKHHGGTEIAERMENLIGLSATTHSVDNTIWDDANRTFALDEEMRRLLQENNPYALLEIMERLLEAEARGYWEPDPDEFDQLKEAYLQAEGAVEEQV